MFWGLVDWRDWECFRLCRWCRSAEQDADAQAVGFMGLVSFCPETVRISGGQLGEPRPGFAAS